MSKSDYSPEAYERKLATDREKYKRDPKRKAGHKESMRRHRKTEMYANNKPKRTAYNREYMKSWRASRKEWYDNIKLSKGCSRCNYNEFAIALEFHHPDPTQKVKAISKMLVDGASFEEMEFEMGKCDLLCANCHRAIHYLEKQGSPC